MRFIDADALQRALLNDYSERPGISEKTLVRIRVLIDNQPAILAKAKERAK